MELQHVVFSRFLEAVVCFLIDPPVVRCLPASAAVDDRNVYVQCVVRARPSLTALYWQIDGNGTTVVEGTVKDEYWTLVMVDITSVHGRPS